ncbi:MAG TPA: SRPBCC family protein [Acidimicrobiales bacterium]
MEGDVVSVERCIPAGPAAIFALVADAARHPEIDGSGAVRQVKAGAPHKLSLGVAFGMSMKLGVGYSMVSTVIEYEEDRRIAWQSRPAGFVGKFVGGRIWRYELEPVEGGTLVRESWDISRDHQRALLRHGSVGKQTAKNMTTTLQKIEGIVTAD